MHNILAKHFGIALGKVATVLTNTHVGDCGGIAQSHKVPIAATPIGKNMKNPRRFFWVRWLQHVTTRMNCSRYKLKPMMKLQLV